MTQEEPPVRGAAMGRHPSTSRAELSRIALGLFIDRGFDETTVEDVASAAGIGRRTFFRYFDSKNDLPWGDFEGLVEQMRRFLGDLPADLPLVEALRAAVITFNRLPPEEIPSHRQRMELLLHVPALVAHSGLRYTAWRRVVAEYAARRLGVPEDSLAPQTIAWALLGACMSAYEQWLAHQDADLVEMLNASISVLDGAFGLPRQGSGGTGTQA